MDDLVRQWEESRRVKSNVATPKPKKKNFWLDQISTVGGIGGGLLGTLASPVLGTALGAGAGSALGEAIENAIMGEENYTKNVAKEGALGAVFGAGPIKLAKGALGGSRALLTGADDVVGAASKAALTPLRKQAGEKLVGAADDLAIKQFRLNKTQLTNLKKTLGEDPGKFIRKYGFQSADDVTTKAIQPLQDEFDSIVANVGNISKKQIKDQLDMVIKPYKTSVSLQEQALAKNLQAQADEILRKSGKTLTGKDVLKLRQLFDNGVNYTQKGTVEFNVSKGMADGLRKTLQNVADNASLTASDGRSLKEVGRELSKLRKLYDVIEPQEQLGRGNLPLGIPQMLGGLGGAAAGGLPVGLATGVGTSLVNSPTGRKITANVATKAGERLAATQGGQNTIGVAGRLGLTGIASGMANQASPLEDAMIDQSLTNSSQSAPNTIPATSPSNIANMDESYTQSQEMSNSPFAPRNLESAIMQIMASGGDMKDVASFLSVAKTMNELTTPKTDKEKPLNQAQQERADLVKALDLTEQAIEGGSINYGPVGSRVEGVKSLFNSADPETLAFKNTISGLRAAITKARAGASLTAGELKLLQKYTPSETDTEQVVRSKLTALRQLYGNSAPQTGGTTLEDALMQLQMQGAY